MGKRVLTVVLVAAVSGMLTTGCSKKEQAEKTEAPQPPAASQPAAASAETAGSGEALFKQHCSACHPDGGNIINPKKTLQAKALTASGITKPADIVKIMRNPGPGMTKFDETTLPDKDAAAIAEYILAKFK
jgi:cytochrome c6